MYNSIDFGQSNDGFNEAPIINNDSRISIKKYQNKEENSEWFSQKT